MDSPTYIQNKLPARGNSVLHHPTRHTLLETRTEWETHLPFKGFMGWVHLGQGVEGNVLDHLALPMSRHNYVCNSQTSHELE